jgi:transposase
MMPFRFAPIDHGLVPGEYSSGERQRRGAITTAGNTRLRWLLVQAAWGIWRDRHAASLPLRSGWGIVRRSPSFR